MLSVEFAGWAQCRLATDPDPYDEPRGVSGYMRSYVGEPDLDRIVRFQDPPMTRAYTPNIGVTVRHVFLDGADIPTHALIGAKVDLLDNAKFEGRNGAIAEDGDEPIVPFHLKIAKNGASVSRATVATDPAKPFREFNAKRLVFNDQPFIEKATGISNIRRVWDERLAKLKTDIATAKPELKPGMQERIEDLELNTTSPGSTARFFNARMEWEYELTSAVTMSSKAFETLMPNFKPHLKAPWSAVFWFGGWDSDAQAFFAAGRVSFPQEGHEYEKAATFRPERRSDLRHPR